jgi:hypothetical protein
VAGAGSKQEAASRKQEAGSRKQKAGSRKQEAGSSKASSAARCISALLTGLRAQSDNCPNTNADFLWPVGACESHFPFESRSAIVPADLIGQQQCIGTSRSFGVRSSGS